MHVVIYFICLNTTTCCLHKKLFISLHVIFTRAILTLVICQKETEENRVRAMSRGYEKEGLPCIHTVWADLLKCHPLLSRTDRCNCNTYVHKLSFCWGGCAWRFIENFPRNGLTRKKGRNTAVKSAHICVALRRNSVKLIHCRLSFLRALWILLRVNRKDNMQQLFMAVWWEITHCHMKLVLEVGSECNPVYDLYTTYRSKHITTWQETNMSFRLRLFMQVSTL